MTDTVRSVWSSFVPTTTTLKWASIGYFGGNFTMYLLKKLFAKDKTKVQTSKDNKYTFTLHDTSVASNLFTSLVKERRSAYTELLNNIAGVPDDAEITIDIRTDGGALMDAIRVAHAIRTHKGRVIAKIDEKAFSAGTLVALCCDEILMKKHAALSPINPQAPINFEFEQGGMNNFFKLFEIKENVTTITELVLKLVGGYGNLCDRTLKEFELELRKYINPTFNVDKLLDKLYHNAISHEVLIFPEQLTDYGFNVVLVENITDGKSEKYYKITGIQLDLTESNDAAVDKSTLDDLVDESISTTPTMPSS